jgi:hypothetical protein
MSRQRAVALTGAIGDKYCNKWSSTGLVGWVPTGKEEQI